MNARSWIVPTTVVVLVACLGCGGTARRYETVQIPPRIDLSRHELIGLVEFQSDSEGDLAAMASRKFADQARRDQGLVRMIDLGTVDEAKHAVGMQSWSPETFQAIGREMNVQTILTGELKVSDSRPRVSVGAALRSGSVSAEVDLVLEVQMIETSTGASLWSRTAQARTSLGRISAGQGRPPVFSVEDPERVYGDLVDGLVAQVTRDFHVSWERRYY